MQVQKFLGSELGNYTYDPIFWERARASRSNTKSAPRSSIRGFLLKEGVNDFEAKLVCREVQKKMSHLE